MFGGRTTPRERFYWLSLKRSFSRGCAGVLKAGTKVIRRSDLWCERMGWPLARILSGDGAVVSVAPHSDLDTYYSKLMLAAILDRENRGFTSPITSVGEEVETILIAYIIFKFSQIHC